MAAMNVSGRDDDEGGKPNRRALNKCRTIIQRDNIIFYNNYLPVPKRTIHTHDITGHTRITITIIQVIHGMCRVYKI